MVWYGTEQMKELMEETGMETGKELSKNCEVNGNEMYGRNWEWNIEELGMESEGTEEVTYRRKRLNWAETMKL